VDPRITIIGSKIKEAVRDGSIGDGHPFNNEEDEDGFKFINGGDLRFTSKGMVNSAKPMPDGVPKVRDDERFYHMHTFSYTNYSSYTYGSIHTLYTH